MKSLVFIMLTLRVLYSLKYDTGEGRGSIR